MNPAWTGSDELPDGNHPDVRRQLVDLIQKGRRRSSFTKHRPSEVRPWEVIHPGTGSPLTGPEMWMVIVTFLNGGVPLRELTLRQPPGEKAWVFLGRLCADSPLIYVKLQMFGSSVLLRSFHEAEYDDG